MAEETITQDVEPTEPAPELPVESQDSPETPEPTEPEPTEPRRDRVSERFNRLTRSLADKDRDIAALQRQIDQLRQPPAPPTESATPVGTGSAPNVADFADYDAYVVAVAGWQAEQALARRETQQREREAAQKQTEQQRTWSKRLQDAQATYTDWDDVLETADVPVTPALHEVLTTSEQGADVLYYLAKHPEEAVALAALPPFAVARAIGRIEARLTLPAAPPPPATRPPAPAPVAPVGGARSGTTADPGAMSPQEYRAWRERQRR